MKSASPSSRSSRTRRAWIVVVMVAGCLAFASALRAQILMNEFVAGGDGREGSADPAWVGINSDTGLYELAHNNINIQNTGANPEPVTPETSPFIDSVFILDQQTMPISTTGVTFLFGAGDATGDTWNHIIKDATHDIDKNCADIPVGGINFQRAIGIHASAGITFNLTEIRDEHGEDTVKWFSAFAGMDRCGGQVNLYAIASNAGAILGSAMVGPVNQNQGEFMQLEIPAAATHLTLATGGSNNSIGCAHGVFADPLISDAAISLPQRSASNPGDPSTCPPTSIGPVSVTINQEGGGAGTVTVTETVIGPFSAGDVDAPGATKADHGPDGLSPDGLKFINAWLLLGPYSRTGGGNPGVDQIILDYLTNADGSINEIDVEPTPGDTVETDYLGAAASTDLAVSNGINPGGAPTWTPWIDNDGTINFDDYYGGAVNDIMMYAVTYLHVDDDLDVNIGLSSDDAVQVLVDGVEVHINDANRGYGGACVIQDVFPVSLTAGQTHQIMVKVFQGGGGHGFRLRLQDPLTAEPISEGFRVALDPDLDPFPFDPNGVELTWNVTRDTLADPGLSYDINIDGGLVNFQGDVGGASILGTGTYSIILSQQDLGPFTDPPFDHAHGIGDPCDGADVTSPSAGEIVITAGGVDIWGAADQCMYAYSEVTGDFSAQVTITARQMGVNEWAKHGIMARQNCSAGSPFIFVADQQADNGGLLGGANPPVFQWRDTQGGAAAWDGAVFPAGVHSDVLRLDRCGNLFIGFALDEFGDLAGRPGEWVEINRRDWGPDAPATLQLGLAVTSHDTCNLVTVTFEDWEVLDECEPPIADLVCTENAAGGLDLSWTNAPGADTGPNISIQVNGLEVESVPGTATSATVDAGDLPAGMVSVIDVINASGIASSCSFPASVTPEAFIKDWLLLGPYQQPAGIGWGAAPDPANMQLDFLTNADGSVNEIDVEPEEGDTVQTDYGAAAASIGLAPAAGTNPNNINPGDVPTWFTWQDADDTVNFQDFYGGGIDQIMMYAVVYLDVPADIPVDICVGSDDGVQVLLDGVEIYVNSVNRGYGAANLCQDTIFSTSVPELNPLAAGPHKIMVKVFQGAGGHGFRLRFQDPVNLTPVLPGRITLEPPACEPQAEVCDNGVDDDCDGLKDCDDDDCDAAPGCVEEGGFDRGDVNADAAVNITDAIYLLSSLFLGGPPPPCADASDVNDDSAVNITDAIYLLASLFLGGPPPPAPSGCNADPTADALDCASFPPCP